MALLTSANTGKPLERMVNSAHFIPISLDWANIITWNTHMIGIAIHLSRFQYICFVSFRFEPGFVL